MSIRLHPSIMFQSWFQLIFKMDVTSIYSKLLNFTFNACSGRRWTFKWMVAISAVPSTLTWFLLGPYSLDFTNVILSLTIIFCLKSGVLLDHHITEGVCVVDFNVWNSAGLKQDKYLVGVCEKDLGWGSNKHRLGITGSYDHSDV